MFPEGTNEFATALIISAILLAIPLLVKVASDAWLAFKGEQPSVAFEIERAAEYAVRLAEQTGFAGGIKKSSAQKLREAVKFAAKWLADTVKITVDEDLITGAIEAKVNELFPKSK